jgi:hypothetical protein
MTFILEWKWKCPCCNRILSHSPHVPHAHEMWAHCSAALYHPPGVLHTARPQHAHHGSCWGDFLAQYILNVHEKKVQEGRDRDVAPKAPQETYFHGTFITFPLKRKRGGGGDASKRAYIGLWPKDPALSSSTMPRNRPDLHTAPAALVHSTQLHAPSVHHKGDDASGSP